MTAPAAGKRKRKFSPRLPPEIVTRLMDRAWMTEQFSQRGSTSIAAELGCGSKTVREYAVMHGITLTRHRTRQLTAEQEQRLSDAVWLRAACERQTQAELAAELGVSAYTVYRWKRKHGIQTSTDYRIASRPKAPPKRPPAHRQNFSPVELEQRLKQREAAVLAARER